MSYQPGIPTGTVPLNQDYLNIQGNFTTLNNLYSVDHIPLNNNVGTPPDGYHKAIHLVPQAPPVAVSGYGEIYTQTLNDGTAVGQQLWYQFINGSSVTINIPLTRNFQPINTTIGASFLPGGIIIQWGSGTYSDGSVVTFAPAMASCFSVTATFANFGTQGFVSIVNQSGTGFTFRLRDSSNTVNLTNRPVNWMAIGK
jgi:hypothetical protein